MPLTSPIRALTRFPRAPFVVTLVAGLGLVAGGVALAEYLRLAACPLCIVQRMLYLLLAALAALGLAAAARPLARRLAALAMLAAAGTGAFVAGYQVYLQRFAPMTTCAGKLAWWEELVEWAGRQLPLLFRSDGLCTDRSWTLLSLSIADWSTGIFAALFLLAGYALLRR